MSEFEVATVDRHDLEGMAFQEAEQFWAAVHHGPSPSPLRSRSISLTAIPTQTSQIATRSLSLWTNSRWPAPHFLVQ